MQDKKFFDAELENTLQQIENKYIHSKIDSNDEYQSLSKWACIGYTFFVSLLFSVSNYYTDKSIVKLQEDVALMQCQRDADKIGAGYAFAAKADKSECQIIWHD